MLEGICTVFQASTQLERYISCTTVPTKMTVNFASELVAMI